MVRAWFPGFGPGLLQTGSPRDSGNGLGNPKPVSTGRISRDSSRLQPGLGGRSRIRGEAGESPNSGEKRLHSPIDHGSFQPIRPMTMASGVRLTTGLSYGRARPPRVPCSVAAKRGGGCRLECDRDRFPPDGISCPSRPAFRAESRRLPVTPTSRPPDPPMPRLVPGGPDVPAELIQMQEAGEMVFFCGAGISVPTGLPGFGGLVDQLYSSLNVPRTASEKHALERGEFDKALDSLEDRLTGHAMRNKVGELLSASPRPGSLGLHRALLAISRSASGIRLVTTNYDDNFRRASDSGGLPLDVGPHVPQDLDNWDSVVHLHGRLDPSKPGRSASTLVLTDSDFGKAYLHDRWAAQFVANLMDRYNNGRFLVGYSMADVVVRYLTKAVSSGPQKNQIYSLVGYADQAQRERREQEWKEHPHPADPLQTPETLTSCFSTPPRSGRHSRLIHTVTGFRSRCRDFPSEPDSATHEADPDRVVWALRDAAAAWPAFNRIRREPAGRTASGSVAERVCCRRSIGRDRQSRDP